MAKKKHYGRSRSSVMAMMKKFAIGAAVGYGAGAIGGKITPLAKSPIIVGGATYLLGGRSLPMTAGAAVGNLFATGGAGATSISGLTGGILY